jgi:hypothetical protein
MKNAVVRLNAIATRWSKERKTSPEGTYGKQKRGANSQRTVDSAGEFFFRETAKLLKQQEALLKQVKDCQQKLLGLQFPDEIPEEYRAGIDRCRDAKGEGKTWKTGKKTRGLLTSLVRGLLAIQDRGAPEILKWVSKLGYRFADGSVPMKTIYGLLSGKAWCSFKNDQYHLEATEEERQEYLVDFERAKDNLANVGAPARAEVAQAA